MKSLTNFIIESTIHYDPEIPSNIYKILNDLVSVINYSELKETNDDDPNRFVISKDNAKLFIDSFAGTNTEYTALCTQEYYEMLNTEVKWDNMSSKEKSDFNTKNGDIIVVDKNNKPVCFVDIKISDKYPGAVSLGSIVNFDTNGYYICVCKSSKQATMVSHKALVKAVKENKDLLNPVVRGKKEGYPVKLDSDDLGRKGGYPVKWEGEDLTSEYFVKGKTIEQIFK